MQINDIGPAVLDAIKVHNWQYVGILGLMAITMGLRKFGSKIPKIGPFLGSNRGGSLIVVLSGISGALVTAAIGGKHLTWGMVEAGAMLGVTTSGGWNVVWDIFKPNDNESKINMSFKKPNPSLLIGFLAGCLALGACNPAQKAEFAKFVSAVEKCGPKAALIVYNDVENAISAGGDTTALITQILTDVLTQAPEEYPCFKDALSAKIQAKYGVGSAQHIRLTKAIVDAEIKVSLAKALPK